MEKIENQCVDCGLPCLGNSCPYRNVLVIYCDNCEINSANYHIEDKDLCKECAEKYLQDIFDDLTDEEKAEALNIYIRTI